MFLKWRYNTPYWNWLYGSILWTNIFVPIIWKCISMKDWKMPLCQCNSTSYSFQLLAETFTYVSYKNWCLPIVVENARWFGEVAYFFITFFNILGPKLLVHWIEPNTWFRHSVETDQHHSWWQECVRLHQLEYFSGWVSKGPF